jgi:kumamolisin
VKAAVHDRRHRPSFLSISWGGAEPTWSRPAMRVLDEVFEDAARLGITVVASSGDQGPSDGTGRRHAVDFPASSPHVLACGGTRLLIRDGVPRETLWNDGADGWGEAGGGRSAVFPRPGYQAWVRFGRSAPHPGRAVPDVSADADPETGYLVRVNGHWIRTAGTSAVAPLWAALLARCAQALGRPVGPLHELLYSPKGRRMLTPVQAGRAHRGRRWYPATGLGTPDGRRLLDALRLHLV